MNMWFIVHMNKNLKTQNAPSWPLSGDWHGFRTDHAVYSAPSQIFRVMGAYTPHFWHVWGGRKHTFLVVFWVFTGAKIAIFPRSRPVGRSRNTSDYFWPRSGQKTTFLRQKTPPKRSKSHKKPSRILVLGVRPRPRNFCLGGHTL